MVPIFDDCLLLQLHGLRLDLESGQVGTGNRLARVLLPTIALNVNQDLNLIV